MAAKVPLPKYADLPEVILFHRDHPAEPVIVLQLPNADRTDAETHVLRTDRPGDEAWIDGLKLARELRDLLSMEPHVAYYPATGHMKSIDDIDMPSYVQMCVADARMRAERPALLDRTARNARLLNAPPVSSIRRLLGGDRRSRADRWFGGGR